MMSGKGWLTKAWLSNVCLTNVWFVRLAALAFAFGLLLLWQLLSVANIISPLFFPSPLRTLTALGNQIVDGQLWASLGSTVSRMALGWLVASIVGIILGALISGSPTARAMLEPTLEFMRPLPASAIIPVAILAFGLSTTMSTAVIAFGSIWPVLLASIQGFGAVSERLGEVGAALEMNRKDCFFKISLPSALPDILAGAKVGLAIALILAVVTEMQASLPGLGQNILMAQRSFKTPDLYAGILMLALIGFITSLALQMLEHRLLKWRVM